MTLPSGSRILSAAPRSPVGRGSSRSQAGVSRVPVQERRRPAQRRRRSEARGKLLGQDAQTIEWWIEGGIEDETTLETTASFADFTIDTDGLDQQQVVDKVLQVTGWPTSRP